MEDNAVEKGCPSREEYSWDVISWLSCESTITPC